jgi:hypothetical protein
VGFPVFLTLTNQPSKKESDIMPKSRFETLRSITVRATDPHTAFRADVLMACHHALKSPRFATRYAMSARDTANRMRRPDLAWEANILLSAIGQ